VLPALLGETSAPPPRDHLVLQNNGQTPLALRQGDWVLIEKGGSPRSSVTQIPPPAPRCELYNLAADPAQKSDLSTQEPGRVKALAARLQDIRSQGHSRP